MEIIIRASVIFWFVWLVTRGLGKRELAEMTPFELILMVMVGDLVQQGVTQEDFSMSGAALAVGTLALWVACCSFVAYRWAPARRVLDGSEICLVRDGEPVEEAMTLERIDLDDLREAARAKGIDDLDRVRAAVLEPDGKISIVLATDPEPGAE